MEDTIFCQSCGMPITDPVMRGTERDESKSDQYCKYCYSHGKFINPGMSYEQMRLLVIEKMMEQKIPQYIIEEAVKRLPWLNRWWHHDYIL